MFYDLKIKSYQPKWYEFRKRLSNFFLFLAKKTYPENPDVWAFMCKQAMDLQIIGQSIVHVDPSKVMYKDNINE